MKKMRGFHNHVKSVVLEKYAKISNANSLLDIGTGRGGDMHKWNKIGINYVIGIDIQKSYIQEAIARYSNTRSLLRRKYKFYYTSPQNMFLPYLQYKKYTTEFDMISCMFAFHYFFESEESLRNILSQISFSLRENGYFVCVSPLGEKVLELLQNNKSFKNNICYIEKDYETLSDFGNKIKFMLSGTLYFGEKMMSEEYLIIKDKLVDIAKEYNLTVVEYDSFSKYYTHTNMPLESEIVSFLNGVIVFKKICNTQT